MKGVIFIPGCHVNKNKYNIGREKVEPTDQLEINNYMMTDQISQAREQIFEGKNIFCHINYKLFKNLKYKK